MRQAYANEQFDRIQQLAIELTETDRKAGRPAPTFGYSVERFHQAEKMLMDKPCG